MFNFNCINVNPFMSHVPGQCLNFNCMFVLVLMLRHCITFLRTRGFSVFLPLDQHIYFHKMTGFFIFGYSVLHTIMHLLNFSKS
jgi:Ferric reductase like transmembrane component.